MNHDLYLMALPHSGLIVNLHYVYPRLNEQLLMYHVSETVSPALLFAEEAHNNFEIYGEIHNWLSTSKTSFPVCSSNLIINPVAYQL